MSMRPHQWVKNLFVLVPLVFAKRAVAQESLGLQWDAVGAAAVAFAIFCAASGAVYLLNDLLDLERDRHHPIKRYRPIASGALPVVWARGALAAVLASALAAALALDPRLAGVVAGYFALNLAYSLRLKHLPFLDVFSISAGFLLRVVGGAVAIAVPVTGWLYVTTFSLATYLALGKRRHELVALAGSARRTRAVLARYTAPAVEFAMTGFAAVTLGCYGLYTVSDHANRQFGSRGLLFTLPFIGYGLWRFARLAARADDPRSPTEAMIRDWRFLANLFAWAVASAAVIYAP